MSMKFLALSLLFFAYNNTPNNGEIVITIDNIKSQKGVLIVALFDTEDDFMKKTYRQKIITLEDAKSPVHFENIPAGIYAVSIIHDENENGELDTNWAGIPKEPFGFSRKSMGNFGPPSFKDTCMEVKDGAVSTTVKMKKIL